MKRNQWKKNLKCRKVSMCGVILLLTLVTVSCGKNISEKAVTEAVAPSPTVPAAISITAIPPGEATEPDNIIVSEPDSEKDEVPETTEIKSNDVSGMNGTYVSKRCRFLTGYSSTIKSNDSGYHYQIDGTSFRILTHAGQIVSSIENIKWEWETFPHTDEEWEALCSSGLSKYEVTNLSGRFQVRLYQYLSEQMCLLKMDDELWLVDFGNFGVWSVYTIVPEDPLNSASWVFKAAGQKDTSMEASLPIQFDMDYTKLKLLTADATLMMYSEDTGLEAYGLVITVTEEATIYWNPYGINSTEITESETLMFFIIADDKQYNGKLIIEGQKMTETSDILYKVTVIGEDFVVNQSALGGAVVRKQNQ